MGFAKVMRDETERRKANEQVTTSLKEKEILLKEIHHRVKNNLQVITSLLALQSDVVEDERVRTMFDEACNRVRSIGDIHDLLYRSPDLARISFVSYLRRLVQHLLAFYGLNPSRYRVSISSNMDLPLSEAIPCGLIVNELLTNALKHAFPGIEEGNVKITLKSDGMQCVLDVADDGIGMADGFSIEGSTSLGLKLVSVLAQQLRGEIKLEGGPGMRVAVVFPHTEPQGSIQ